jgi:histidinol dehydrogenase
MKILEVKNIDRLVEKVLPKTPQKNKRIVESILADVQKNGDRAVKKYEKKFDKASINSLRVTEREIGQAYEEVSDNQIEAIHKMAIFVTAREEILKDIKIPQKKYEDLASFEKMVYRKFVPIPSVGCYVPGGLARYPSSAVMSIVPAKVAGVKRVVVVSPPNQNGKIDPLTLVACYMCGANEIYKIGGAQAIGALAYGTKSIKKVNKIVGPGGSFVSIAKALVCDTVSIDMIAGPTELGIIADTSVDPNLIVNDLFSQAEHSKDTFCFVITTSRKLAEKINKIMNEKISQVSRSSIIKKSLSKNGFIAVCKKESDMITLANELAPEHLQIMTRTSKKLAAKIDNAGLILLGKRTPSAFTDYLLGTNHILPTSGFAKVRGGLSVLDFMKLKTEVRIPSDDSVRNVSLIMKELTDAEQLPNHYEAIRSRFE